MAFNSDDHTIMFNIIGEIRIRWATLSKRKLLDFANFRTVDMDHSNASRLQLLFRRTPTVLPCINASRGFFNDKDFEPLFLPIKGRASDAVISGNPSHENMRNSSVIEQSGEVPTCSHR